MKSVIKELQVDGCTEQLVYNIHTPKNPLALNITLKGEWYYSTEREYATFIIPQESRKEILVKQVLPVLTTIPMRSSVWIGRDRTLSIKVQKALFSLGYHWYESKTEVENLETDILVLSRSGEGKTIEHNLNARDSNHNQQWTEIWPWQIPGFETIRSPVLNKMQLRKSRIVVGGNDKLSHRVQRVLFSLGIRWVGNGGQKYLNSSYHLFISDEYELYQTPTEVLGDYPEALYKLIQPEQIPGFFSLAETFSSSTNTIQHDTKGTTLTDPRAAVCGGLRAQIGTGKIAGSQRLVGKPLSAKPCQGTIRSGILVSTILIADSY